MLTRLHVSGFKNLVDVDVRFGPFTCIAGANGTGKSKLFDAIQFLGRLASGARRAFGGQGRMGLRFRLPLDDYTGSCSQPRMITANLDCAHRSRRHMGYGCMVHRILGVFFSAAAVCAQTAHLRRKTA